MECFSLGFIYLGKGFEVFFFFLLPHITCTRGHGMNWLVLLCVFLFLFFYLFFEFFLKPGCCFCFLPV